MFFFINPLLLIQFQQQQQPPSFQSVPPRPPGSPNNRPITSSSPSSSFSGGGGGIFNPFFPNKKREVSSSLVLGANTGGSVGGQKPISLKEYSDNNVVSISTGKYMTDHFQ